MRAISGSAGPPGSISLTSRSEPSPTRTWKQTALGAPWVTGDTYQAAIGQGFVQVNPLQLANMYAAIGNGGTLYRPRLVTHLTNSNGTTIRRIESEAIGQLPVTGAHLALIRHALDEAVQGINGTGFRARTGTVRFAAKTGTAEYAGRRDENGNLPSHSWFAGYAPHEDPEIAFAVLIRDGGEGSHTAAPGCPRRARVPLRGQGPAAALPHPGRHPRGGAGVRLTRRLAALAARFERRDAILFIGVAGLITASLVALAFLGEPLSAGLGSQVLRQSIFVALGAAAYLALSRLSYRVWWSLSWTTYALAIILLLAVLVFGVERGGSQRWFLLGEIQFQPSEFAKIALIVTLARFYTRSPLALTTLRGHLLAGLITAPLVLLVLRQPDLAARCCCWASGRESPWPPAWPGAGW